MSQASEIRAVTLDVGGTLIDPWPSAGHVYAEVAATHGFDGISPDLLNRQFAAAWRSKSSFDYTESSWCEMVALTFRGICTAQDVGRFFAPLYARFQSAEVWRLHPDVLPALEIFQKQRIRLAVISNWDDRLRVLLDRLGLTPYFEAIVVSGEIGFHKPSPEIFRTALQELGLPGDQVLHIGDHPIEDIQGARAVGMQALQVARNGSSPHGNLLSLAHHCFDGD